MILCKGEIHQQKWPGSLFRLAACRLRSRCAPWQLCLAPAGPMLALPAGCSAPRARPLAPHTLATRQCPTPHTPSMAELKPHRARGREEEKGAVRRKRRKEKELWAHMSVHVIAKSHSHTDGLSQVFEDLDFE